MYLLSGQKKKKNLLPDMYSCPKDEHIRELTMKPMSERNKIKQDICHKCLNLLLATPSSLQLKF